MGSVNSADRSTTKKQPSGFTLANGRPMVAIPGPSVVPDRVLSAMHRPMPNIYAGELPKLAFDLVAELPEIVRTSGSVFMVVGNGHAAWQMAICNTLSRGDKVLVVDTGQFARMWGEMAELSGVRVETVSSPPGTPADPDAVRARLTEDAEREIKAVLMVHTDTATSVRSDVRSIRNALEAADHPALLQVDCIASLGCEPVEMDAWGADIVVGATQKGLMTPPGLGLVWASSSAIRAHERADLRIAYLDFAPRLKPEAPYFLFGGTPPIPTLYGLREALDMIAEEGLENVWRRHEVHAQAVWAAVDAWSSPGGLQLNVKDPAARSHAVTTVLTGSVDADRLRAVAEDGAGLTLGVGAGALDGPRFRIGHMGHLNPPMILGTLATVEAALLSMGIELETSGVAAAARRIQLELAAMTSPS